MSSTVEPEKNAYPLPHASNLSGEHKRLDDQHKGIQDFIGETLSFAPLESNPPKAILDLGCGNGAWAIQAAATFPDSEVLAVDRHPIPPRPNPLPHNLKFRNMDVSKPFALEPGTFDVVHARFVFLHLPTFEDVLQRAIQLLRPGGWLILEDSDRKLHDAKGLGSGQKALWEAFQKRVGGKEANPLVGSTFEGLLHASGSFSEVNVKKVDFSLSRPSNDPKLEKFRMTIKTGLQRSIRTLTETSDALGITEDVGKQALDEMNAPEHNLEYAIYFVWACKRL